jgi:hypothetical protein
MKRRSNRNNKQDRRVKARRINSLESGNEEYKAAVWLDALEGVDLAAAVDVDEDEYDELEDLQHQGASKKRKKRVNAAGVMPKRFLPRSLASILIEEANTEGGIALDFLNAEARLPNGRQIPPRHFCPVTGIEAMYREARSNIYYANLKALEQIRERSPPWLSLGGSAAFYDAAKSIRDDVGPI